MGGGHHAVSLAAMPKAEQDIESFKKHKIPLAYRDTCGHLLVDLNVCRRATFFNPHQCTHQRHTYEECEYIAWQNRVETKTKEQAASRASA
jgi:hypothetical protein